MKLAFGTWADRPYETISRSSRGLRQVWHAQRLIQTKYPDPTKCPRSEADYFHHQAVELVKREDEDAKGTLQLQGIK